ncbi:MAG: hypothetical protein IJF71_06720 [Clostridia bacterium]|nr:hypothetical protein [Clostridia bacterium]
MAIWWEALSVFQQVMICLAVPSVLLFVLQIILVLCGIGNEMEIDTPDSPDFDPADVDTPTVSEVGSFRLITLRGILGFLAVGGWTAYGLNYVLPAWAAGLIGIVAGAIMAVVLALIFYFSKKLESDGTLDISGAVGKVGTVYIPIPAKRAKSGKINLMLQERYAELEAVTDEEETLHSGTQVKVVGVVEELLIVKRL